MNKFYQSKSEIYFFEYHYDDMCKKNYTYSDISKLLKNNNFKKLHKNKMPFKKIFEYLWVNNDYF